MKEIEFDYILQWWLREPQPPRSSAEATGNNSSGTVSFGFESLSHRNHRELEPQPPGTSAAATKNHRELEPQPPGTSAETTGKDSSGTVPFLWLREPQPPGKTARSAEKF